MSNGLALDSGSDTLSVTITSESTGLALSLFSDPPRTVPVTNPFTLTGRAVVYVAEQVTAKVSVRDQGVEVATAGGAPLTYDFGGGRISEIEVGTKPISRSELRATYITVVGTPAAPLTDPATARPAGAVIVYWVMANAVTPTNATAADIIWNAA